MKQTTLCYVEKDDSYLLLHRIKKKNDENYEKWIGIGGKIEDKESPFDCIRREAMEEVGLTLNNLRYRGIVTFVSDIYPTEYMHLFYTRDFDGEPKAECDEGVATWVKKCDIEKLPIWQGDKIFLELLDKDTPFFSLKLEYRGELLVSHTLDFS